MKYDLVSDLHLDHKQSKVQFNNELVIVAGDTTNGLGGVNYLNKLERQGHKVFAIDGNHEHYQQDTFTLGSRTTAFYDRRNQAQVMFLNNYKLGIIGANGWYEIEQPNHWANYMADARFVFHKEVNEQAVIDAAFIEGWLQRFDKAIVVTHSAPCQETLDPRYEGSDGNAYFWNPNLDRLLADYKDKIVIWHHGHTHYCQDKVVNGVRIVTNPRGYPGENPIWAPKEIEI